ncbi:hypothetical protein I7X12_18895 [Halosimplex litoreum]|uniref:Halobacterial output domain-containing protein n=1 Tax=Halosimplex litoreum TaxID=1198301 RepID=A0A7T3FXY1_9EURY|nr:HalOD1 output domain-containing protein [Halosimplex litoreum]QPV62765.1 hypothetical protein I7X12_18895 [Halosimplex litoreum]
MTDAESIPVRVVEALASALDEEPTRIELQLADHVPPEALRALAGHENDSWWLTFETGDYRVSVDGSGTVEVTERTD